MAGGQGTPGRVGAGGGKRRSEGGASGGARAGRGGVRAGPPGKGKSGGGVEHPRGKIKVSSYGGEGIRL